MNKKEVCKLLWVAYNHGRNEMYQVNFEEWINKKMKIKKVKK